MIILIILIILVLLSFNLFRNLFKSDTTILDEVKLKESEPNNNGFALMLQKEDGTYKESNESTWPTDMKFNSELSGCIDVNGNIIENALSFDTSTNAVTISTNKTVYCYLYFDLDKEAPIVTSTINNNNTKNVTVTISSNEDGEYCINNSSVITDMNNCVFNGNINKNESITTEIFTTSNNYYVHVKDNSNNIGISEVLNITIPSGIGNYLIENVSSEELWDSTLEDDGYRYVGTNPSNYICFGTSDKDTCLGDTDKYMYRIIGVFEDENGEQHVKLIKKEALNTEYAWNSSNSDVDWDSSTLYQGINGSYFLTNTRYPYMQDTTWTDKIATWKYTMTNTKVLENYDSNSVYGPSYHYNTGKVIYLHELNKSGKSRETCYHGSSETADCNAGEWKTLSTKISLMYTSDYALSLGSVALNYTSASNYSTMKTGWMYLWKTENDSTTPSVYEWTMSRRGRGSHGYYYASCVDSIGLVDDGGNVSYESAVRPVFYLESDVEISGGTGTISDPFLITY